MSGLPIDPTLPDLLREAIRSSIALLHTSIPGEVLSYDRAKQTAQVKLVVRGKRRDLQTGTLSTYSFTPLVNVPVVWPGGGDASLTFDLSKGDRVVVIFAERDISRWLSTGTAPSDPADTRRHDLSDAIAIPQINPYTDPLASDATAAGAAVLRADDIRLGSATASSFIALAPLVLTELQKITTWMTAMNMTFSSHTHVFAPGGPSPTSTPVAVPPVPPTVTEPASSKVRST